MRNFEREDELIQPSTIEEIARGLVEANAKVKNGRYEIPVPFQPDVLKTIDGKLMQNVSFVNY